MPRRPALYTVLAALTVTLVFIMTALARPALSAAAAPVRIMPLGDSITAGPGCWRALLWNRLQTTGYTNIDFVGSVPDGGCNYGFSYDGDNEGHGGYSATGIADQNQLPPWLNAAKPDIVLMHLGTNDLWGGTIPTDTILAAYTKMVGQMRANNPDMKIIVAQIIPMACNPCASGVVALNNAIPGWAAGLTTARSPIVVVDQWTGFNTATDTGDGVHPNDAGFRKMADRWYPALARVLDGVVPPPPTSSPTPTSRPTPTSSPTPTSRPTPTSSPSTTPPPSGTGCVAAYRVISQWAGAFQGEVTVKNASTSPSSRWTATFTYANGQQVSQVWNVTLTQNAATVTARSTTYNGSLAPGASTTFGFLASWNNVTNEVPPVSCTLT
ncbi:cellulose binding domain-containing protein [Planosporangium sp. 12N6]|uniref:cellulose binding domain-containing protein n=1 Tax=Planosporangium spinosum TaxID=3402278 RepID=UPI003CFB0DCB